VQDLLNEDSKLAPESSLAILLDVAVGMNYLHTLGIIHRDIKPLNLLCFEGATKICDFGRAKEVDEATLTAGVGSGHYIAPESVFQFPPNDPTKLDLWSFGFLGSALFMNAVSEPFKVEGDLHHPPREYRTSTQRQSGDGGIKQLDKYIEEKGKALAVFSFFKLDWLVPCLAWNPKDRSQFFEVVQNLLVFKETYSFEQSL
jgi:serine/threonine protein kinase